MKKEYRSSKNVIEGSYVAKLDKSKFEATPVSLPEAEKEASREVAKFSAKKSVNTAEQKYVGFANLPNQIYRKSVKDGFEFNLMVCGSSGLGKSTLMNSLFLTDIYSAEYPGPSQRVKKTLKVEKQSVGLKENGIQLNLTVIDTPGFGDSVNNDKCWEPIQEFIDLQFDNYLNQESRVQRPVHIPDTRVHICLYFIAPTGHGLKPIDIEFMRRLH